MKANRRGFLAKLLLVGTGAVAAISLTANKVDAKQGTAKKSIGKAARYKDSDHNRRYYQSAQF